MAWAGTLHPSDCGPPGRVAPDMEDAWTALPNVLRGDTA